MNIYPRISLISTYSRNNAIYSLPPKFRNEKRYLYAGWKRRGAIRTQCTMPEKLEEAKRRGQTGVKGSTEDLKLLREIGKIFELPRRSNYELCRTKPTLWRCARAFAHMNGRLRRGNGNQERLGNSAASFPADEWQGG